MFHESAFYRYLTLERRFSSHTLKAYENDLSRFVGFCTDTFSLQGVEDVKHTHIRAWIVRLMQDGEQTRSINRRLSCLKSYFRLLMKKGILNKDPMQKVTAPKTGKKLPVFVQESQLEALFVFVDFGLDYTGRLHRLILELLYGTGIRRSELSNLKIADIDFSRSVLRIKGKGGKERLAPFAPYLESLLREFIDVRRQTFPSAEEPRLCLNRHGEQLSPESIYYVVRKYLSAVTTVEQRSPHVLRHSFATHLSNNGADLNAIKELLGHSSLAATQVYMHNNIERLIKVYEQAHPKGEEAE